jgi:hypothetical protein
MISEKNLLTENEVLRWRTGRAPQAVRFFRGRKNSTAKRLFFLVLFLWTSKEKVR